MKGECSVDPSVAWELPKAFDSTFMPALNCPPGLDFSLPAIVPNSNRLSDRSLLRRATALAKQEPPFTDGRSDALATCHVEGLRVREGDVVGTRSALEVNDSQEEKFRG